MRPNPFVSRRNTLYILSFFCRGLHELRELQLVSQEYRVPALERRRPHHHIHKYGIRCLVDQDYHRQAKAAPTRNDGPMLAKGLECTKRAGRISQMGYDRSSSSNRDFATMVRFVCGRYSLHEYLWCRVYTSHLDFYKHDIVSLAWSYVLSQEISPGRRKADRSRGW